MNPTGCRSRTTSAAGGEGVGAGGGGFGGGGGGGGNLSVAANQPVNFKLLNEQQKSAESTTQPDTAAKKDLSKSDNSALNTENQAEHEVAGLQNGTNQNSLKQKANYQNGNNLGTQNGSGRTNQQRLGSRVAEFRCVEYRPRDAAAGAQQVADQDKSKSDEIAPFLPPSATGSLFSDATDAATTPLFVARAMTRQEAARLAAALSTEQTGQTADFYPAADNRGNGVGFLSTTPTSQPAIAFGATTTQPTTAPTDAGRAIAAGDRLTVTVAQLVGPGVDKTNTVQVADNGTINLPMIDEPVAVAGDSAAAVGKRIAAKYHEANLIDDATVTVTPAPATQPVGVAEVPATQPGDNQTLDVVVVVQKNSNTPQLEPATQPAGAAPDATPPQVK